MLTIELESIPVHFWQISYNQRWQYCAETGYNSIEFDTFGEALAAAKQEIKSLVQEYGCLPMFPIWDVGVPTSEEF